MSFLNTSPPVPSAVLSQVVRVDELEDGDWLVVVKDRSAVGEIEECLDAVVRQHGVA
jgi:hypothetical protein